MTFTEVKEVVEYMRSIGADRFKFGELEVHFGTPPSAPIPTEQDLTDEEMRETALEKAKETLKAVIKADEADLYYST